MNLKRSSEKKIQFEANPENTGSFFIVPVDWTEVPARFCYGFDFRNVYRRVR
jgi:hypothetical protein